MTIHYTSRSAIMAWQTCPRKRYLEYGWGGTGLSKIRATIPLATGSWVHSGLADMLRQVQGLESAGNGAGGHSGVLSGLDVDQSVQVALDGYRAELAARGLDIELGEDGAYVAEEQLALVEGMLRAYAKKGLGELIEKYEVLEVEREDVWKDFAANVGFGNEGDQFIDLQARADALLRERSSGDFYLLSFKTAAGWDYRRDGEGRHDVQGLSEAATVERRLQGWWRQLKDSNADKWDVEHALMVADGGEIVPSAMFKLLFEMDDPPRIMGIQMVYLIKGRREQSGEGGPYITQSHLLRGWSREGVTDREYAWRWKWDGPDTWPDSGKLRGHTLGKGWTKFDSWTANGGVKAWIELLAVGAVQPEIGMDPLESTYHMPLPYFRQDRDLQSWVKQAQAQERQLLPIIQEAERVREEGDAERLLDYLDSHLETVQNKRSCDWPSKCQFQEICFGDTNQLINPLASGLYSVRIPHHEPEKQPQNL